MTYWPSKIAIFYSIGPPVTSVGIDLKELGGGGVQLPKCLKFCPGLKFKADFHSKMSVCRHELGFNPPQQFQPCLSLSCNSICEIARHGACGFGYPTVKEYRGVSVADVVSFAKALGESVLCGSWNVWNSRVGRFAFNSSEIPAVSAAALIDSCNHRHFCKYCFDRRYRASACVATQSAKLILSDRPSFGLWHTGIVSKRLNRLSKVFNRW